MPKHAKRARMIGNDTSKWYIKKAADRWYVCRPQRGPLAEGAVNGAFDSGAEALAVFAAGGVR
jgi:hypothetical protein